MSERTLAIVLSGGGMNGLLLELGFLRRLREDPLWESVGWIYGTSAGALTGVMAVVDRLDALERFVLQLAPDETFRPNRLWQLPLTGLHEYALPDTIAERLMPIDRLARDVVEAPIEFVVCVTDVSDGEIDEKRAYERVYSSRTTDPDELARAILASAAISALVFPLRVGDVIGTDGGWVRNFPLGHAYDNPAVGEIVGFQYIPRPSRVTGENLGRLRRRLEPFRAVPPVRALLEEVRAAEERQQRGEPGHLAEMIGRLMRVTVARNTTLEVRSAEAKDASVRELEALRADILASVRRNAKPWRRGRAVREVEERFAAARFPFRHDRALPLTIVRGSAGELALDPGFRSGLEWPVETKRALIDRGRTLADEMLERRTLWPSCVSFLRRPEAGFAGREARHARPRRNREKGARGGNMVSPTSLAGAGRHPPCFSCPTPGESGSRGRVLYPFGLVGWRVSSTLFVVRFPSLSTMVTLTVSPGLCAAIMSRSSSTDVTFLPSSATIMSPPSW